MRYSANLVRVCSDSQKCLCPVHRISASFKSPKMKNGCVNSFVSHQKHILSVRMVYTEAVLLETLRISSVAPVGIPHMARDDARLGDYIIPKVRD